MDTRPYDLFMSAFNDIEAHLKRSLYGDRDGPTRFRQMLDDYKQKRARHLRPRQHDALIVLADLRNTLVHGKRISDQPLAEPTEAAVEAIRRLREEMLRPATVIATLKQSKPFVVGSNQSVRQVLDTMYENDFSQVPVYDENAYTGLLTTNTVARWVADQMRQHDGLAEDAPVAHALEFSEGFERVLHLPRDLTTTEALWRFTNAAETGHVLTAIIVTHGGKTSESPLCIVVAEDLARLSQ